ncbi:MAG TPA: tRNA 2-thiocytidine(32) synthetase TtcA [Spirochaetaceae bacterium]|jgi:tRNA(Ile)-lysidine synthase TilS/MesJ|nr:tRNA 2-thiocytidine(32) synthetase TtcA [Spirochaetaceae bacterium]
MHKSIAHAVDGLVVKALKTWDMIAPGERVLIGASGGKDSAVLARDLALKKAQGRLDAELTALHIRNDFTPASMAERLAAEYEAWGLPLVTLDVAVVARLKPGRRMNCYWCSTQRRTELIRYAMEHGYTAVALGHHLDDVLETLFMNMLRKAELSTMPPVLRYRKYPLKIIRPLYLVEERQIVELAEGLGILASTCTCAYNDHSERDRVRDRVEALTKGSSQAKRNLLESLRHINAEYLP